MTLKVKVSHELLGYQADVLVTPTNPHTGQPTPDAAARLKPGESCEMTVHSSQTLVITEAWPPKD